MHLLWIYWWFFSFLFFFFSLFGYSCLANRHYFLMLVWFLCLMADKPSYRSHPLRRTITIVFKHNKEGIREFMPYPKLLVHKLMYEPVWRSYWLTTMSQSYLFIDIFINACEGGVPIIIDRKIEFNGMSKRLGYFLLRGNRIVCIFA